MDLGAWKDEFVVSMAALALYDGEAEITSENIKALLDATGNTSVAPYWPALFTGLFKNGNIEKLVFARGGGGGGGGGGGAAAAAAPAAGGAAPAAKEEKPKVEEVDALDGGMDMFGGGDKGGDY